MPIEGKSQKRPLPKRTKTGQSDWTWIEKLPIRLNMYWKTDQSDWTYIEYCLFSTWAINP